MPHGTGPCREAKEHLPETVLLELRPEGCLGEWETGHPGLRHRAWLGCFPAGAETGGVGVTSGGGESSYEAREAVQLSRREVMSPGAACEQRAGRHTPAATGGHGPF